MSVIVPVLDGRVVLLVLDGDLDGFFKLDAIKQMKAVLGALPNALLVSLEKAQGVNPTIEIGQL